MLRNHTIAGMRDSDLAALIPWLTERRVDRGEVLIEQGAMVETVHFPTTAYLANTVTFSDGRSAETFIMGVEGVSALPPFLADAPCGWAVEVKASGSVYSVPARVLRAQVDLSPDLRRDLLRLCNDYHAQAALGVACAGLHDAPSRLARFLLVHADRAASNELRLTQEDLATLLGVQRTTVNAAAMELKAAGAIRYSRGVIRITDLPVLKRAACECYDLHRSLLEGRAHGARPDPQAPAATPAAPRTPAPPSPPPSPTA